MKVFFIFERETKGAVRYMEVDAQGKALEMSSGAQIGTLYIRKSALPKTGGIPQHITMDVQFA